MKCEDQKKTEWFGDSYMKTYVPMADKNAEEGGGERKEGEEWQNYMCSGCSDQQTGRASWVQFRFKT